MSYTIRLILMIALSVSVVYQAALGSAFENCGTHEDSQTVSENSVVDLSHLENTTHNAKAHPEQAAQLQHSSDGHEGSPMDCHCPMHHHGCSHSPLFIAKDRSLHASASIEDAKLIPHYSFFLDSLFLEGPFQPPKA